jgi:predicted glycoside hydrolase/deacetylase ChbG (UPF0249 family)
VRPIQRRIAVCADDFGIDAPVSDAILELLGAKRLSATSVLVSGPGLGRADELRGLRRRGFCSIGLHFTLTEASVWRGPTKLPLLLARTNVRLLPRGEVRDALTTQLDRFEHLFGMRPDFLDGHEHVHQLPVVRDVVLDTLAERYGSPTARVELGAATQGTSPAASQGALPAALPAIRSTRSLAARGAKAHLLGLLGGYRMANAAADRGLVTNTDFAGVYSFSRTGRYRERVLGWLHTLADGGLLMCHPGSDARASSIGEARYEEYRYLSSAQWPEDLSARGVQLIPFGPQRLEPV